MHHPLDPELPAIDRLRAIVHILRSPGGCPWDIEQTPQSLIPNILEEAYEAVEAIRGGNSDEMREELGDLLLQVVMQSEMASESGGFDLDAVAIEISDKLVRRHPHVFGDVDAKDTETVLRNWEDIKRSEKGDRPKLVLHKVGEGLPALMRATKIQKKVERVGFDWPSALAVIPKIREELDELEEVLADQETNERTRALEEELGDVLFAVTNLTRKLGMDAESLLAAANEKFVRRFNQVEQSIAGSGKSLESASPDEMESAWRSAKEKLAGAP